MAALVLSAIIQRFEAVLEASPLSLKATKEPFSFDHQPNSLLNNAYRIQDGGLGSTASATNNVAVRIDTLKVWVARKMAFDGQTAVETIEDTLTSIERLIKADGLQQSYHAELAGREVQRKGDLVVAAIELTVNYDFSET